MEGLRFPELLIVLAIFMLLFGGSKLPQAGAAVGKAIRSFKDALNKDEASPAEPAAQPPPAQLPPSQKS
jgi:sec-independent protein translocase protein TatA